MGDLISVGMCGFGALMFALAFTGSRHRSYLRRDSRDGLVFRRPQDVRTLMLMVGLSVAVGGPIFLWYFMVEGSGNDAVLIAEWAAYASLFIAAGVFGVRVSGPEDLHLDLERRTYRRVSGWPLFPAIWSGAGTTWRGST